MALADAAGMTALRSILRGAAPLTALEALGLLLALLTLPYLMRVLGPADFGRYAFGVAAGAALAALVDYGFNQLGPRRVAQAAESERAAIFWSVQTAKLGLAALVLLPAGALAWLPGLHSVYADVMGPALLAVAGTLLFPQWYLQGLQRYRLIAGSLALARCGSALATLALVRTPQDAALAVGLQTAVGAAAGLLALADGDHRQSMRFVRPGAGEARRCLRQGLPLFLSTAAVALYTTCVPIILGLLTSPATVGLFSAGDKLRAAVQMLLAPIGVAAYPEQSRRMLADPGAALGTARQLLALQVALGVAAALAIALLAEPVIRVVIGEAFLPAVPAAQLLGLCIVFTAVSNTLGMQVMLPLGMERAFSVVLSLGAAIGLLTVWALAPRWQERGAALAVLAAELFVALAMAMVLALVLWRRRVR